MWIVETTQESFWNYNLERSSTAAALVLLDKNCSPLAISWLAHWPIISVISFPGFIIIRSYGPQDYVAPLD